VTVYRRRRGYEFCSLEGLEATAVGLDCLNAAVEAFGVGVSDAMMEP
jgi:hypothetical protein